MAEFNIRSDAVDVERIMEQIRARIREKRGADYTEEQIRELANVKLERFLDPRNVRSDLLAHYRKQRAESSAAAGEAADACAPVDVPAFKADDVYRSSRGGVGRILNAVRRMLRPVLKLFINPGPLLETVQGSSRAMSQMLAGTRSRAELDVLTYEVLNNLVVEMTRLAIEMKNHKMRVESVAARLDFDERRARALEEIVQYRTPAASGAASPAAGGGAAPAGGDGGEAGPEKRRRRRRRGRRRAGGGTAAPGETAADAAGGNGSAGPGAGGDAPAEGGGEPRSGRSPGAAGGPAGAAAGEPRSDTSREPAGELRSDTSREPAGELRSDTSREPAGDTSEP